MDTPLINSPTSTSISATIHIREKQLLPKSICINFWVNDVTNSATNSKTNKWVIELEKGDNIELGINNDIFRRKVLTPIKDTEYLLTIKKKCIGYSFTCEELKKRRRSPSPDSVMDNRLPRKQ